MTQVHRDSLTAKPVKVVKSSYMGVMVEPEMRARIEKHANVENVSLGNVMRAFLEDGLALASIGLSSLRDAQRSSDDA